MLVFYRNDGTTLLDGISFASEEAGADSDVVVWKATNEGETTSVNALVVQRTVDPTNPDNLLAVGPAPQNEMWGRIRITGFDNTADPSWPGVRATAWLPVGSFAGLIVGDVPAGCWVYGEYKSHPPSSAAANPWTRVLVAIENEHSLPLPPAVTRVDRGVLTGIGDPSHYGLVSGLEVTVSGSPDDEVHAAAGFWVHAGILYGDVARDYTLDQDDGASSALTAGQSYWAAISCGAGTRTVTKGLRGSTPAKPALPTGDILVRYVKVDYQVGASVIEGADLDGTTLHDRYLAAAGSGLNLLVHPGQAQAGSTYRFAGGVQTVPLPDDTTSYVWQLASGLFETTEDEVAPEGTALGPLWEVDTASGAIVEIRDRRTYAGRTVVLHLRGTPTASTPGELDRLRVEYERLFVERIVVEASDNGGGAADQSVFDSLVNGTTVYTDFAVDDQRPTIAWDATGDDLVQGNGVHQVTELRRGDVLSLEGLEYADGDASPPARVDAYYICRVP